MPAPNEQQANATVPRILLVDDDRDVAYLLGFVLKAAGFDISHTISAKAAMEAVKQQVPDLMILDLMMPEMDGAALLRWLRQDQGITQPVMVLTGTVKPGLDERLKQYGADAVAHKPLDMQSVTGLVKALLAR